MSKDNVKQMFEKIEKDAALKGKYAELMQAHQKEAEKLLTGKIIELGKTSGFAFSNEDLLAARAELMDKVNSNKELSDGDLANVAGGSATTKALIGVLSLALFGVGCITYGLISVTAEVRDKGSCSGEVSATAKC